MHGDPSTSGDVREEPNPSSEPETPLPLDFMSSVMARFAQQDEIQKQTQAQLAMLVAALTAAPAGQTSNPRPFRRQLFNTNPTVPAADDAPEELEPTETPSAEAAPAGPDLTTIREIAALKLNFQQMSSTIHKVTSAAPQIESVLASTERTPFTSALTDVNFRKIEKMRVPQYKPGVPQKVLCTSRRPLCNALADPSRSYG
ncbi:hypothetical protein Bca101_061418 [Brassica carinata]